MHWQHITRSVISSFRFNKIVTTKCGCSNHSTKFGPSSVASKGISLLFRLLGGSRLSCECGSCLTVQTIWKCLTQNKNTHTILCVPSGNHKELWQKGGDKNIQQGCPETPTCCALFYCIIFIAGHNWHLSFVQSRTAPASSTASTGSLRLNARSLTESAKQVPCCDGN